MANLKELSKTIPERLSSGHRLCSGCGASTTTTPSGKESYGKHQRRKDLTAIVAAHRIPYVATGSISHWNDLITKSEKAFAAEGPAFLNVISMCHRG